LHSKAQFIFGVAFKCVYCTVTTGRSRHLTSTINACTCYPNTTSLMKNMTPTIGMLDILSLMWQTCVCGGAMTVISLITAGLTHFQNSKSRSVLAHD
jgi:hypothetical protein